jgi:probable rRNA maturation factor
MPISLSSETDPLTAEEIERLWQETIVFTQHADDEVAIRFVNAEEIRRLNREYRKKDAPTNVLTFSYDDSDPHFAKASRGRHDIALCLSVAGEEARQRGVVLRDYVALLLVHAFLHAVGMDHESSSAQAVAQREAEQAILTKAGFAAQGL